MSGWMRSSLTVLALVLWLPLSLVLTLALLRPFKAVLIALQFKHKAGAGDFG